MKKLIKISLAIALPLLIINSEGCKKGDNTPPDVVVTKQIKLASSKTLGNYLVGQDGRTLYYFSNDFNGQNSCAGGCEAVWPYFNVINLTPDQIGEGLAYSDFATITAANGKKQLTYKNWPLYYYAPSINGTNTPEASGQTTGEGVGGVWFVAKPDYSIMLVSAQLTGHDGKTYTSNYTEGTGKTIYFSDSKGLTLYTFKNDKANTNTFTKSDFSNDGVWPIYQTDQIVVPSILDKSLFSSISVFGKKQLTYKGWPLYYFGQDAGVRGSNKGISFPLPGTWPVAVKDAAAAP